MYQHHADEGAALRSLEYMDSHFHVQLHDYNYELKEHEVNRNRSLLKDVSSLTSTVVKAYNLLDETSFKLTSVLGEIQTVTITSKPNSCPQDMASAIDYNVQQNGFNTD